MSVELDGIESNLATLRIKRDKILSEIAALCKEAKKYQPQPKDMKTVLFPIVRDFNCMIGKHLGEDVIHTETLFGCEAVHIFEESMDIYNILVKAGCFESKGQARKNWQGIKEIPTGYSEIGPIGKQKLMLFIWNPTE